MKAFHMLIGFLGFDMRPRQLGSSVGKLRSLHLRTERSSNLQKSNRRCVLSRVVQDSQKFMDSILHWVVRTACSLMYMPRREQMISQFSCGSVSSQP